MKKIQEKKIPYKDPHNAEINISIKVHPRSSKDEISGFNEGILHIKLKAAPVDGKANEALVNFLAKFFDSRKKHFKIIHGEKSRDKIINITGIPKETIFNKMVNSGKKMLE